MMTGNEMTTTEGMLCLELYRENLLLQIRQLVWEGVYFILYLSSRAVMEVLP